LFTSEATMTRSGLCAAIASKSGVSPDSFVRGTFSG
jgi:hypothetical protein